LDLKIVFCSLASSSLLSANARTDPAVYKTRKLNVRKYGSISLSHIRRSYLCGAALTIHRVSIKAALTVSVKISSKLISINFNNYLVGR